MSPRLTAEAREERKRRRKYRRARIRHFMFTHGPNRLTGGRLKRRHLRSGVIVREVSIVCPTWPRGFDGMRIAHVSDFHLGDLLPLDDAVRIVHGLSDLEPDLVACTGDVVDLHNDEAPPLLEALAGVRARFGSTLVLGNHDELDDGDALARMAQNAGVVVLRNEAFEIAHNGDQLTVAGIDWGRTAPICSRHVDITCGEATHLLLSHNPKAFLQAARQNIPLTLAGHTHGGQIAMKKRPGTNLSLTHRRSAGLYEHGGSKLFVTTGVGAWFPLRINCPAEVAMLTVRCGE